MSLRTASNRPLAVILVTAALDAVGMGLVIPVLPTLLREVLHRDGVDDHYGYFLSLYALMQFVFSPILGALSDRFGRRPVLLISLAGAAIDYTLMAFAPTIGLLYLGRVIAGVTGANMAVATAYLADISSEEDRAKRYGYLNAAFGVGFVVGPVIGGLIGSYSTRYPFLAAAVFNGLNFLLGVFVLPESHRAKRKSFELPHLNPFRSLGWVFGLRGVLPFVLVYALICCVGQVPQSTWVLHGEHRFGWAPRTVGMTFAFFGLLYAVSQAFLTGRLTARFGERRTLLLALIADNAGFLLMAFATRGWMGFAICIPLAIGGIAMPALQSILSKQVDEDQQGELQGTLVAVMALATIFGPLVVTHFYGQTKDLYPSPVWLVGSLVYLLCFPIFWYGRSSEVGRIPSDRADSVAISEGSPAADEYSSPIV